jgi:dienelactone hydrolase
MLLDYYSRMCVPKPLAVCAGDEFQSRRRELRKKLLQSTGLAPLPERVPLDLHESAPLDHPWCVVWRVHYQLWPGVYASGLLFMPKAIPQRPAPVMLCPHGHWENGNAHPEVQRRCLNFARLGYVTFSSTQNHYEDLYVGVSHQTLMIWNNMRALDYLESLPEADRARIGVAGASGGGLQTQMLAALDDRVKAAAIVGLTCDFREIMFPDHCHCTCNHFPGVMRFTDHPETSALGLPAAVLYITMNDWTKTFREANFPTIRQLYAANAAGDRVECLYFDTPHTYDKPKREATYRWMDRWLDGRHSAEDLREPDESHPFPVETLVNLKAEVPGDKGFGEIGRIYRRERGYQAAAIASPAEWRAYRDRMTAVLRELLGEDAAIPRQTTEASPASTQTEGDLVIERTEYPSEGGIRLPVILLRSAKASGKLPVVILCDGAGGESLLKERGPGSAVASAEAGSLVVLPDVRFTGAFSYAGDPKKEASWRQAWDRNGIVWGRPVPGLTATDLRAVLDGVAPRPDADMARVTLIARKPAALGIAALFAAVLDPRIAAVEADLEGRSFEKRDLPLVSCILQHGDVPQWAAALADRKVTLRNPALDAESREWLEAVFTVLGNGTQINTQ